MFVYFQDVCDLFAVLEEIPVMKLSVGASFQTVYWGLVLKELCFIGVDSMEQLSLGQILISLVQLD